MEPLVKCFKDNSVYKVPIKTAEGITLSGTEDIFYWISDAKDNDMRIIKTVDFSGAAFGNYPLGLKLNVNDSNMNIIVPDDCKNINGFETNGGKNYFKINGTLASAYINAPGFVDKTVIDTNCTTLKVVNADNGWNSWGLSKCGFTEIDLSDVTFNNNVTVPEGSTVYVKDEASKSKILLNYLILSPWFVG